MPFFLRDIETYSTKLLNGVNRSVHLLTPFYDLGAPKNRKEFYSVKFKIYTGGTDVTLSGYKDGLTSKIPLGTINASNLEYVEVDVSSTIGLAKALQLELEGDVPDFQLSYFSFTYDIRPEQTNFLRLLAFNSGTGGRKRISEIPIEIDTLDESVTFRTYKDGVLHTVGVFNTGTFKTTKILKFNPAILVKDLEITLHNSTGVFEFYTMLAPTVVEAMPVAVTYFRVPVSDLGIPSKKRVRTWPFVLSSPDEVTTVTFTPIVDGIELASSTHGVGSEKRTFYHYFETDVFGVDFAGYFTVSGGSSGVEVSSIGTPEVVQILPVPKKYDQLGPVELFKYGKIKKFEIRLIAFTDGSIPVDVYFQDTLDYSTSFTVENGIEKVFELDVSKTTAGTVMRVELGPTSFAFHRLYARFQVARSGHESGIEWIPVPNEQE